MGRGDATTASGLSAPVSRRAFAAGALGVGLAALGRRRRTAGQEGGGVLSLLCWEGYDDPEVTRAFRERTGLAIEATYLAANDEIFTFLRAGGIGRYDLVTPQNGVVTHLVDVELIQPLDEGRLPNLALALPAFQRPSWALVGDRRYAAPFLWGTSPLVYRADRLEEPPASWRDLEQARFRERIVMADDGLSHLRVWNRLLNVDDPMRVTVAQLNRTVERLIALKEEQVVAFTPTMVEVGEALARGEAWLSTVGWESLPRRVAGGDRLRLAYPDPGSFTFCDSFCLAAGAPNPDAAYAYIDFMLSPEAQARAMTKMARGVVNAEAIGLLDEATRGLYPYDDLDPFFARHPLLGFPPLEDEGDGIATYVEWVKGWERVRYARLSTADD